MNPSTGPTAKSIKEMSNRYLAHRYRIHDFKNYINRLDNELLSSIDVIELLLRTEKIEWVYKQYEESAIQYKEIDHYTFAEEESQFYKALAKSKYLLLQHNNIRTVSTSSADKSTEIANPSQFSLTRLPMFNGSYSRWLHFRETFKSLIHSNDMIEDIEKFRYLRGSVEGSAATLIQSVDFTDSNYAVAWKLINERYNNKHKLAQCCWSSLFNTEAIKEESSVALKGFIDLLNKNLQELELLGVNVKQCDMLLLHMFTSKLDQNTRREWVEYSLKQGEEDYMMTVDALLQFLRTRADLIETLEMRKTKDDVSK